MYRYVDQKGSAAKRSVGVTPEVNLRNPLHVGDEESRRGIYPCLWEQGQTSTKAKTGTSVGLQKKLLSPKNFQNDFMWLTLLKIVLTQLIASKSC